MHVIERVGDATELSMNTGGARGSDIKADPVDMRRVGAGEQRGRHGSSGLGELNVVANLLSDAGGSK